MLEQQRAKQPRQPGDRRDDTRIEVSWPVRVWVDEEALIGRVVNASSRGLGVATAPATPIEPGKEYRLEVLAEGPDKPVFVAEVRHVRSDYVGMEIKDVLSEG